jgi:hypothetical protein
MSRGDLHLVTASQSAGLSSGVPVRHGPGQGRRDRDRREGTDLGNGQVMPSAGQPGHGILVSLRRQPARLVKGRMEDGYTGAFEVICCYCGDHPYLDYSQVSPQLQRLRGPFNTIEAGLAAYDAHLGLAT